MYRSLRGIRPLRTALLQTDGSFRTDLNLSRTACILTVETVDYKRMASYFDHRSHIESEWCSILDGLYFAASNDQGSVDLENDNQAVVNCILRGRTPYRYADYFWAIRDSINTMDYVGLRWIPRELNKSDELFRI
jgi:hypothetical protein